MPSDASPPSSRLLQSEGWAARVDSSFVRSSEAWQNMPEARSHGHVLRRLFEDPGLKIDAVLCMEGRPTVCVKDATHLSDEEVLDIRGKLWNLGATTLLIVERPSQIQVFSTFLCPTKDNSGTSPLLDEETVTDPESTALALQLRQFIRRVETGVIYREEKNKLLFDPKMAVDQLLLKNLREVRDLICPHPSLAGYRRAHALIGRFLFSCYLIDRGIIGEGYLTKNGLPDDVKDMQQLLVSNLVKRGDILESLFKALQRDFNGSLFGEQDTTITDSEIEYFRRMLSGEEMSTGQLALFKLYDFSYIPVELISSIYQEFLAVESEAEAEMKSGKKKQSGKSGQRAQGAYYTPPRLAELTIDIATEGWDTLLDKRCLDGACGSGIFLVILFVRMAEEWRHKYPDATTSERYEELRLLLAENIRGVDISLTACLVTCFSLYLAFLDQMEPKEITELRMALEHTPQKKLLPRILWEKKEEKAPQVPRLRTIREHDFFDLAPGQDFDLVVGNPPWVSRKEQASAQRWIFSEKDNPAAKGLLKKWRKQTLFPATELACGFMWKVGLHTKPEGRACQVLPSRVFLSNNTDRFQAHWLNRYRLESMWLLADYRFILFPGAECPCFIGRYRSRKESEAWGEFEFVTPKVETLDPREAIFPVQKEDQKRLSEQDIFLAAGQRTAALAWKKHHWGTPRDVRLVERLMRLPKLKRLVSEPPNENHKPQDVTAESGLWWKGQGFKPFNEASYQADPEAYGEPKMRWWDDDMLYLSGTARVHGLVLMPDEAETAGKQFEKLHRQFRRPLSNPPLLVINQGCTKFLYADFPVIFEDSFLSICAPRQDEDKLRFLTAVMSSPLAKYLLFHTTANMDIERDIAGLQELLELPFPLPENMPDPKLSHAIMVDSANIIRSLKLELSKPENFLLRGRLVFKAQEELNSKVYEYFNIPEWGQHLVEDTVDIFLPSSTPGTLNSKKLLTALKSIPDQREKYADELVKTFRDWSRTENNIWATTILAPKAGLAMLTLGVGREARDYGETIAEERIENLLDTIRTAGVRTEGKVFRCMRGFTHFEGTTVHLLKPLSLRHWTRTAALNDADAIVTQMIEEGGWSA